MAGGRDLCDRASPPLPLEDPSPRLLPWANPALSHLPRALQPSSACGSHTGSGVGAALGANSFLGLGLSTCTLRTPHGGPSEARGSLLRIQIPRPRPPRTFWLSGYKTLYFTKCPPHYWVIVVQLGPWGSPRPDHPGGPLQPRPSRGLFWKSLIPPALGSPPLHDRLSSLHTVRPPPRPRPSA